MSSNKMNNLLASLTGDLNAAAPPSDEHEQDLFGDVPIDDDGEGLFGKIMSLNNNDPLQGQNNGGGGGVTAENAPTDTAVTIKNVAPPAPTAPSAPAPPSLLAGSGLLEDTTGGGLFDAVDQELEKQKQQEALKIAQQERQQQELLKQQEEEQQRAQQEALLAQQMQQQQQQMQQAVDSTFSPGGFYRNHHQPMPPPSQQQASYNGNLQYSTTGGAVQTHTLGPRRPTTTAGMHAAGSTTNIQPPSRIIVKPPTNIESPFLNIKVSEPMLVASSSLLFVSTPHWSYQIETLLREGGTWLVRRRFRHVVALEERLRVECPGSILPPRPDKHATRAIEEASTSQSAEFALQRAHEIQVYLNELSKHPIASTSNVLRLFLALQDDMGTAWPEVSSNALTRLGAVGAGAALVLAESTSGALPSSLKMESYEDNAELLALASSEELRMGAVSQAVPKLEGSVTLIREHGESAGAVGMELSKLTKEVETTDVELGQPLQILSQGLLRGGRRERRLAMELSAAMSSFVTQYKLCKNERLAFQDRRQALAKCQKERAKADERAQRLLLNPSGDADRVERDAVMGDTLAVDAVRQADEIGRVLKEEVNRVAYGRRTEWSKSMKVVASAMKEASTERVAIWESTRESFLQAFPDMAPPASSSASVASGRTA